MTIRMKIGFFGVALMILTASCSMQPNETSSAQSGMITGSDTLGTKIEGGFGNLEGFFYNGSTKASDQNLYLRFKITSDAPQPAPLEFVKFRYYFTADGAQPLNYTVDYAGGRVHPSTYSDMTTTVRGAFYALSPAVALADHYFEVTFDRSAGSIYPKGELVILVRIGKSDWSAFNQANDFSFNPTATDYADWDNVPLYFSGTLTYGIEP